MHVLRFGLFMAVCIGVFFEGARGQDTTAVEVVTKKDLMIQLYVWQISYTNWAKGGDNAFTYRACLSGKIEREYLGFIWYLKHNFVFGQTHLGDKGTRNSVDKIDVYGNFTWENKFLLNPYLSVSLNTQFATGFDYKKEPPVAKSDFWDPAYVVESMGTGLVMNDNLKNKFGFAVKETFTRKYRTYSDDPKSTDYKNG